MTLLAQKEVFITSAGLPFPHSEPVLRDYILLITILVAFLEAAAQQLSPQPPAVVMGFGGIKSLQKNHLAASAFHSHN